MTLQMTRKVKRIKYNMHVCGKLAADHHPQIQTSEIDNDAYCVCTHDFSPCTHRNFRPVRTMYGVKISGTQTVCNLMRTQIKIPLKLSQNDNLSTSIVRLLCQQSKGSYNMNAASDRFIFIPCNILCIFSSYTINV